MYDIIDIGKEPRGELIKMKKIYLRTILNDDLEVEISKDLEDLKPDTTASSVTVIEYTDRADAIEGIYQRLWILPERAEILFNRIQSNGYTRQYI